MAEEPIKLKKLKYDDIKKLIEGVKNRPCLWDRTMESYKDRNERKNAWEEIFSLVNNTYDSMQYLEKKITGERIVAKWTNIRDTFIRTLKQKAGKKKKKYIYYDDLKFLIKVLPEGTAKENEDENEDDEDYGEYADDTFAREEEANTSYTNERKRRKTFDKSDDYVPIKEKSREETRTVEEDEEQSSEDHNIDFVAMNDSEPRLMNEDEAFFASLLPTVVRYNDDERLEFRIGVLDVMKRIKNCKKEQWN